jgi:hypothetical protein
VYTQSRTKRIPLVQRAGIKMYIVVRGRISNLNLNVKFWILNYLYIFWVTQNLFLTTNIFL